MGLKDWAFNRILLIIALVYAAQLISASNPYVALLLTAIALVAGLRTIWAIMRGTTRYQMAIPGEWAGLDASDLPFRIPRKIFGISCPMMVYGPENNTLYEGQMVEVVCRPGEPPIFDFWGPQKS